MPPLQRSDIPEKLLRHLTDRIRVREIPIFALKDLADWADTNPMLPRGQWFKRFSNFTLCGEGSLPSTILKPSQTPIGEEVQ